VQDIATLRLNLSSIERCHLKGAQDAGFAALFLRDGIDFSGFVGYAYTTFAARANDLLGEIMEWTAPAFEEVCLNCEINSYASAKL
jgi:coenzyme PQQ precursor peptide PqqA